MKDNELLKPSTIEEEDEDLSIIDDKGITYKRAIEYNGKIFAQVKKKYLGKDPKYTLHLPSYDEMCKEALINKYKFYGLTYKSFGCYISPYGYSNLIDEIFWDKPFTHHYKFNKASEIIHDSEIGMVLSNLINGIRLKKLAGNNENMIDEFHHVYNIKASSTEYYKCEDNIDNIPTMVNTIISQRYALSFTLTEYLSRYGGYHGIYADFWALDPIALPQFAIIEDEDTCKYNLLCKMKSKYGGQVIYVPADIIEKLTYESWHEFEKGIFDKKVVKIVGKDIFIKPTTPIRLITCPAGYAKGERNE